MRLSAPPARPLLIAHRAANVAGQLKAAADAGADMAEGDVRYHRGRLEVRHLKTMGLVPLLWDRWKLAPGWTKRYLLGDLLRDLPPGPELLLDIKRGDHVFAGAIREALRAEMAGREYSVCSQFWSLLEPFRQEPGVLVIHSVGSAKQLHRLLGNTQAVAPDGISIHKKLLTPDIVRRLRGIVPVLTCWPVNDLDELRRLESWGVTGFTIDRLELIAAMRAQS